MSTSRFALDPAVLEDARTQGGSSLAELSRQQPQLVVFLRHAGCTFCRQALADIAANHAAITAAGTGLVLIHMESDAGAAALFAQYGLADVPRISDPERRLYQAFALKRGGMMQVAGPAVWFSGLKALAGGNLPGIPSSDVFQLPGAFLVHDGEIVRAFRAETSADRPDYCELATAGDGKN
ncbi:MAG TPA: SelL-related redox protein [Planctomycetaceae bacterium]|jgi:peroxiredoxin|nr:SelL-related redox protein [Planctomycetaceae bacterium]